MAVITEVTITITMAIITEDITVITMAATRRYKDWIGVEIAGPTTLRWTKLASSRHQCSKLRSGFHLLQFVMANVL
jgi:hypothetical protein